MNNLVGDLSPQVGTLVLLLGIFASICGGLVAAIYKSNSNLIVGITKIVETHLEDSKRCQESLPTRYASKVDTKDALDTLFRRQNTLREDILPKEYIRRDEVQAWALINKETFQVFSDRLDKFGNRIDKLIETLLETKTKIKVGDL